MNGFKGDINLDKKNNTIVLKVKQHSVLLFYLIKL